MVSKQRQWQLAKLALGLCQQCGKGPRVNRTNCEGCRKKNNLYCRRWKAKLRSEG